MSEKTGSYLSEAGVPQMRSLSPTLQTDLTRRILLAKFVGEDRLSEGIPHIRQVLEPCDIRGLNIYENRVRPITFISGSHSHEPQTLLAGGPGRRLG
jgi:hypothetical protein